MRYLFFILSLSFTTTLFGQDDVSLTYENGNLKLSKKYYDSCLCDSVKEFYEAGSVMRKATYKFVGSEYLKFGDDILFYENGNIISQYIYEKGLPDGEAFEYYENSILKTQMFFINGFKSSTWKLYDSEGNLEMEIIQEELKMKYNSQAKNGTYKHYFKGDLAFYKIYEDDELIKEEVLIEGVEIDVEITGKKLFKENCASCHHKSIRLAGPPLKGVVEKRDLDWLVLMIRDGDNLVKSGDKLAIELFKEYHSVEHPEFEYLSDEEIFKIIDYLKTL